MTYDKILCSQLTSLLLLFIAAPLIAQDAGEPDKASLDKSSPNTIPQLK